MARAGPTVLTAAEMEPEASVELAPPQATALVARPAPRSARARGDEMSLSFIVLESPKRGLLRRFDGVTRWSPHRPPPHPHAAQAGDHSARSGGARKDPPPAVVLPQGTMRSCAQAPRVASPRAPLMRSKIPPLFLSQLDDAARAALVAEYALPEDAHQLEELCLP